MNGNGFRVANPVWRRAGGSGRRFQSLTEGKQFTSTCHAHDLERRNDRVEKRCFRSCIRNGRPPPYLPAIPLLSMNKSRSGPVSSENSSVTEFGYLQDSSVLCGVVFVDVAPESVGQFGGSWIRDPNPGHPDAESCTIKNACRTSRMARDTRVPVH